MATKREYAISLGLAKPGKGRMSVAANNAIAEAIAKGITFDEPIVKAPTGKRRVSAPKIVREKAPSKDSYNPKDVRAWAEQTGLIEKGKRGKLPTSVINSYLVAHKDTPAKKKSVRTPLTEARTETVGWTYARRGPKDPAYISEPLVAVTTCGGCTRGISTCRCSNGPTAPKFLGGETLLLTRPKG